MSDKKPKRRLGRPRNPRPENPHCGVVWDDQRSAKALAERLGVHKATVDTWRNGIRVPPRTVVEVLLNDKEARQS